MQVKLKTKLYISILHFPLSKLNGKEGLKLQGLILFPGLPNSSQGFAVVTYFIHFSSTLPCCLLSIVQFLLALICCLWVSLSLIWILINHIWARLLILMFLTLLTHKLLLITFPPPPKFSQIIFPLTITLQMWKTFHLKSICYYFILQWHFDNRTEVKVPNTLYADRRRLPLYRRQKKQETRKYSIVYALWMGDWITDDVVWNSSKQEEACQEVSLTASPQMSFSSLLWLEYRSDFPVNHCQRFQGWI